MVVKVKSEIHKCIYPAVKNIHCIAIADGFSPSIMSELFVAVINDHECVTEMQQNIPYI